jgi:hypothetical protein
MITIQVLRKQYSGIKASRVRSRLDVDIQAVLKSEPSNTYK